MTWIIGMLLHDASHGSTRYITVRQRQNGAYSPIDTFLHRFSLGHSGYTLI